MLIETSLAFIVVAAITVITSIVAMVFGRSFRVKIRFKDVELEVRPRDTPKQIEKKIDDAFSRNDT